MFVAVLVSIIEVVGKAVDSKENRESLKRLGYEYEGRKYIQNMKWIDPLIF